MQIYQEVPGLNVGQRPVEAAAGVNRHGSDPDVRSAELPEPGSVKDKIGIFTANSNTPSLQDTLRKELRSAVTSRPQNSQQVASRLPARRSSIPGEKTSIIAANDATSDQKYTQPESSDIAESSGLLAPKPVRSASSGNDSVARFLRDNKELPLRSISMSQKPVMQSSSSKLPDPILPSTTKDRPTPPLPRKGGLPTSAPRSVSPGGLESSEGSTLPHSFGGSRKLPDLPNKTKPVLPSRSNGSQDFPINNRLLLGDHESPNRPFTPSSTSISSRSHNDSSSSLLDEASGVDGESLSNASVTSTRVLQAKKVAPPPPRQRRQTSHLHPFKKDLPQTLSPPSMRQALRARTKVVETEHEHHKHRLHIIHKHPHKHHEGDRKRWQSEVSGEERKRYEGIWASNKGLLIPKNSPSKQTLRHDAPCGRYPSNASEMVVNIVVRDIWSRSRLQPTVLEQIWNLVDGQKIGLLTKEEFVVGMWLIDQQLKGHKLPTKVSDSVWNSVKRVSGISLPNLPT